jgi:hypothetical protein
MQPAKFKMLQQLVNKEEIELILEEVKGVDLNYKSSSQLKQIFSSSSHGYCMKFGKQIWNNRDVNHVVLSGILFERAKIWERDVETTTKFIKTHSVSDDWQVREVAIQIFKYSLIRNYIVFKDLLVKFINSKDIHLRRVALSTAEKIINFNGNVDFIDIDFLNMLNPFFQETDSFITSVSTSTFGQFIKNYPDLTVKWANERINEMECPYAKASVLYMFSTQPAINIFEKSMEIVDRMLPNNDERVNRARSAVIQNFSKYYPEKISSWLENRMNQPNAVDHWAELEVNEELLLDI